MQGHDEDAVQPGVANNSSATPSEEGAIFSTPSLTISTEHLPPQFTSGAIQFGATADASPASDTPVQPFSFASGPSSPEISPEPSSSTPSSTPILTPRNNTFNSTATGDIKLPSSGKKKSKVPVFIGVFVLIAAAATGAFFLFRGVGGDGVTEEIAQLFLEYRAPVEQVEGVLSDIYFSKMTTGQLFMESMHDELNTNIPKISELQRKLANYSPNQVKKDQRENFTTIQTALNTRAPRYEEALKLYNILYAAMWENDTAGLTELEGSENSMVGYVAREFMAYVTKLEALGKQQNADAQLNLIVDFTGSLAIPRAVFGAFDDTVYYSEALLAPKMAELISSVDKQEVQE